jgi:hypothetical protein
MTVSVRVVTSTAEPSAFPVLELDRWGADTAPTPT